MLAKAIDDAVAALPPIDELLWQDKEAIDAVTAQYDSAPAEVKAAADHVTTCTCAEGAVGEYLYSLIGRAEGREV